MNNEMNVIDKNQSDITNEIVKKSCENECKNTGSQGSNPFTTDLFRRRAVSMHGEKYDYSIVKYVSAKSTMSIICPKHGIFIQASYHHLSGHGCPKCVGKGKSTKDIIEEFRSIHGDKFDYSDVIYQSNSKDIIIKCITHGKFLQTPNNHLRGRQCPKCSNEKRINTLENFMTLALQQHGNRYDYSKSVYIGNNKKLIITCKKHGDFSQIPNSHLNGRGCPKCRQSTSEEIIRLWLENNSIKYVSQKSFNDCRNPITNRQLKFDFFIPDRNLLIEYDGPQHYKLCKIGAFRMTSEHLTRIQYRDNIKTRYAQLHGINLIRIKYTDLGKVEEILTNSCIGSKTILDVSSGGMTPTEGNL